MPRLAALLALLGFVAQVSYAQVSYPPVDTSTLATKSEVQTAQTTANQAATDAAASVKTVNSVGPVNGNVAMAVPTPATTTPPAVADSSALGTQTTVYALANHTHASKARKGRVLVPATGALDVTFSSPFTASPPICAVVAEATLGDTNVVNAQIDGTPTMTSMRIRITRTQQSVVSLIGLTVLSVPTQIATYAHYVCLEP